MTVSSREAKRMAIGRARVELARKIVLYAILVTLAVVYITPLVYVLSLSFQTRRQAMSFPPSLLPRPVSLEGYQKLIDETKSGFHRIDLYARNSVVVAVVSTVGSILSCSAAAFAFARIRFKGRNILFFLLICTLFVPAQVYLIPLYAMYSRIGWIDTLLPLTVPHLFGTATGIFMLRQFFAGIPQDLEDAAIMDGANRLQMYYQIFMPIAGPALATWAVLSFLASWNDLLGPLVFTISRDMRTLPLAIAYMTNFYDESEWFVARLGMSVLTIMPVVLLFIAAQKYVIQGIVRTGLKG